MESIVEWVKNNQFILINFLPIILWGIIVIYIVTTKTITNFPFVMLYVCYVLECLLFINNNHK